MTPYKIEEKADYFVVTIDRDVVKGDLLATYYLLAENKKFLIKNSLWLFKGDIQPLNYDDGKEMIKISQSSYPSNAPQTVKNAFVCDSKFVHAAAELYAKDAAVLPFEIKVFNDCDEALQWLTE
jgi:hypothetical protein